MEPGRLTPDPPARLVGGDLLRPLQVRQQALVVGFEAGRRPEVDLGAGAATQVDAEQGVEDGGHLAVRQAGLLVQQHGGGLGVGSDLAGGRAEGVRGLQGVAALHAAAAAGAVADVDVELADDGPAGDVGLVLVNDFGFDEPAVAVGAVVGEGGFVALGDLLGRRRGPMAVSAVGIAGFAAGGLGVGPGRPLAEGGGLSLGGGGGCFQGGGEALNLGLELFDGAGLSPGQGQQFVIARKGRTHRCRATPPPVGRLPR